MPPPPKTVGLHLLIQGHVQGVGYRYFTVEAAQSLDLVGWVRNLPDGPVEAYAEGEKAILERFIEALRQGPPLSRVTQIDPTWQVAQGKESSFQIR